MNKSESIANLALALSKFQGEVSNPKNTAKNPQFNSKYAPLQDILALVRPLLSKQGLSLLQSTTGDLDNVSISTILIHESGEFIETDPFVLKGEQTAKGGGKVINVQGAGSMITYIRRYQVSAILGIASEDDDDGNHTSGNKQSQESKPKQTNPLKTTEIKSINWPTFWLECKKLGYDEKQVHALAKVESLKDWDRSMLDELYRDIKKLAENAQKTEEK